MPEVTPDDVKEFLATVEGQSITLGGLRHELRIGQEDKSFDTVRVIVLRLVDEKILRPTGRRGEYRVVKRVNPIECFEAELSDPVELRFPRDHETGTEMDFAEDLVIRGGDLILIAGRSNFGKTQLCMGLAGENIDSYPILMGNEYTTIDEKPSPRFLKRLRNMSWVEWQNGTGKQKFTLLPVRADYAEHIVKDRINIIDWINIDGDLSYSISKIMESIKRELGAKGVGIITIQKGEGANSGRGGQYTKDFADVEILLDKLPESDDVLLTIGKVKEAKRKVLGRTFAYMIEDGIKIINFRELTRCKACYGKGWRLNKPCDMCNKSGFV